MSDGTILLDVVVETDKATGEIRNLRRASEQELGKVERSADEAAEAVEDVGDAGTKAAGGVRKLGDASSSVDKVGGSARKLDTGFQGAGESIGALTSATELFGGKGSAAVSSVGGAIASLATSGVGPLAIGLAALTTATALFAGATAEANAELAESEALMKSLREESSRLEAERDLLGRGTDPSRRRVEIETLRRELQKEITFSLDPQVDTSTLGLVRRLAIGGADRDGAPQLDRVRAIALEQMFADPNSEIGLEDRFLTDKGQGLRDRLVELQKQERIQREIDERRESLDAKRRELQEEQQRRLDEQLRRMREGLAPGDGSGAGGGGALAGASTPFSGDFEGLAAQSGVPFRSPFFDGLPPSEAAFLGLGAPGDSGASLLSGRFGVRSADEIRRAKEAAAQGRYRLSAGEEFGGPPSGGGTGGDESSLGEKAGENFAEGFSKTAVGGLRGSLVELSRGGDLTDIGSRMGERLADGLVDAIVGKLIAEAGIEQALTGALGGFLGPTTPGGGGGSPGGSPSTPAGIR